MSNAQKAGIARAASINEALAQAKLAAAIPHVYSVAPKLDGTWGVFCLACSHAVSGYVYPCGANLRDGKTPPAVLIAPSKMAEFARMAERLQTTNSALAYIAAQLGLWDEDSDDDAKLNTVDIFKRIGQLVGTPFVEEGTDDGQL